MSAEKVMYASSYAREQAEKRAREEAEALRLHREEEDRVEREKAEQKRQKKAAAMERAARAADKLAEKRRQVHAEAAAEAERVDAALKAQDRARRDAAAAARREAEQAKQRVAAAERKANEQRVEAKREKERAAAAEQDRKRKAREDMLKREHMEAEKRWLKSQVKSGQVKIQKKGSFVTAIPMSNGAKKKMDDSWIKMAKDIVDEDDPSIPLEVLPDPEEERHKAEAAAALAAKKKPAFQVAVSSNGSKKKDVKWIQDGTQIQVVRAVPQVKPNKLSTARQDVQGIIIRLDTPHEQNNALLDLFAYIARLVAFTGVAAIKKESETGLNVAIYQKTPAVVAKILSKQPGNILCMLILGLQAFAGSTDVRHKVAEQKAIPPSVDRWIGWLLGTKLFFQYRRWKEEGESEEWEGFEDFGFGDEGTPDEVHPNQVKVRQHAAESKLRELIIGVAAEDDVALAETGTIMKKFKALHQTFLCKSGGYDTFLTEEEAKARSNWSDNKAFQESEALRKQLKVQEKEVRELQTAVVVEKDQARYFREEKEKLVSRMRDIESELAQLEAAS